MKEAFTIPAHFVLKSCIGNFLSSWLRYVSDQRDSLVLIVTYYGGGGVGMGQNKL